MRTATLLVLTLSLFSASVAIGSSTDNVTAVPTVAPTHAATTNLTLASLGYDAARANNAEGTIAAASDPTLSFVRMPRPKYPTLVKLTVEGKRNLGGAMHVIASGLARFWDRMSRGKVKVLTKIGKIGQGGRIGRRNKIIRYIPGISSEVPFAGNAVSARHEMGHEFGLQHAGTRTWKTQTTVGSTWNEHDPFDPLSVYPDAASLNAPHLHYLKWFSPWEEVYAQNGGQYDLRVINDGKNNRLDVKALYYPVPGTDNRRYWFSYVKLNPSITPTPPGMPGTGLAIHTADDIGTTTYLEGLLGVEDATVTHERTGLRFALSNPTPTTVHVSVSLDRKWQLQGNN